MVYSFEDKAKNLVIAKLFILED